MSQTSRVQKATITKLSSSGSLDSSKSVTCQFNPTDFEIKGAFKWERQTSIGSNYPNMTFSGGEAQDMTITFLFDSTESGADVRDSYAALLDMAAVDPDQQVGETGQSEPARCQFQWGQLLSFDAVITDITQKFLMFKPDGTPVRATVTVTFAQVGSAPAPQNPTSRTLPRKVWVVREGERLDWIAYQEYGNSAHWRHIAESNNLVNPDDLRPGQVLQLVPLP